MLAKIAKLDREKLKGERLGKAFHGNAAAGALLKTKRSMKPGALMTNADAAKKMPFTKKAN